MYFELQLSANIFTRIVRNRLKALPLCIDREFADTDGKLTGIKGALLVVDRIEIGDGTTIQRELAQQITGGAATQTPSATQIAWIFSPTNYTSFSVPFLQIKQPVSVYLVKSADLETNGPNASAPFPLPLSVQLVFNVSLTPSNQTTGGGPLSLSYSLAYIDYGLLLGLLSDQQRADFQQFVAGIQLPPTTLDLHALSDMLHRPVSGINAGIVCDDSGSLVVIRADFDVYNSPIGVTQQFFTQPPENLLEGKDWVMLIDHEALLADGLAKSKKALTSNSKLKLNSGPDVSWDPTGPALDIHAGAELVDACPFFVDDIDMDVDIDIRLSISIGDTPNTVRSHYYLHGDPSDIGEEIACAVTGALLWPFIGPLFLKDEDIGEGLGAYMAGLAGGPVVTFFGILAAIETKKLSDDISDKLGDTCKKSDDENYECNDTLNIVMQLSPGRNSKLEVEQVAGVARGLIFRGTVSNFPDFVVGGLEQVMVSPFKWQILGRCQGRGKNNFRIGNQGRITVIGSPPMILCGARILNDPEGEFVLTRDDNTLTIVPQFKPAYVAAPYPCQVRVITGRGVRTITLQPAAARTVGESKKLEQGRLRAQASCYYWEKIFTPLEKIKWLPDPPFDDGRRIAQFWQLVVRGLKQEDSLRVKTARGTRLVTVKPSRSGVAHFAVLLPQDRAQQELILELSRGREEDKLQREITTQQVLFEHCASLPVVGPLRSMRLEGGEHDARLVITAGFREVTWNVAVPTLPSLLQSVAMHSEQIAARAKAAVEIRWSDLVVHNGKRLSDAASPNLRRALTRLQPRYGTPDIVGNPRVGGISETLYLRAKDVAVLFDISNPDEPRELHIYHQPAWFEDVALGGKLLAQFNARLGMIDIYRAAFNRRCECAGG